jgi:hypothetical protein
MKTKNGKQVPNCVPESVVNEEQINELSADTYKNTVKSALQRGDSKGNSIAVKALQSFGKEIAKELAGKSFEVKGSMKDVTKALYKGSSYSYINQVKMTFTGEGSLFHNNNVKVFGSDEVHFNMNVQFQLPDNIGGFASDVKFRGYQNNKIPATVQFSIKQGKVWVWFKGADTDLEFTRAGAREMAKLADTIVTAMDFPTKAKHNTIKQFDAMKPTFENFNPEADLLMEAVNMAELEFNLKRIKKENPGKKVTYFFTKDDPKGYKIQIKEEVNEAKPQFIKVKDTHQSLANGAMKHMDSFVKKIQKGIQSGNKFEISTIVKMRNILDAIENQYGIKESTPTQVIKDLDKAKNDLLKKVDALIAKKKKLYSDVDIEAPMSADEKKLDKDIADLFSQINKLVLQKRSVKKESVNEAYVPSNIKDFAKRKGVTQLVNTVAGWAERVGKKISGGTAVGRNYDTLVLDMTYNGSEIRINCETERVELYDELVRNFQQFKKVYDEYQMDESINESKFSDIDIMAQEAPNFKEFVKEFYKEFRDFPKTKDSIKWLLDIYNGRTKMEGLGSDGLERVAQGLPQTEEEPINEESLSDLESALKSHDWWYAYSDDSRRYNSGERNWNSILRMIKSLKGKEAEKLWNKYVPKDFNYTYKKLSEGSIDEGMFKIGIKHIIPLIPTGYAPNDPKYKMDLRILRNMLNNFYQERGYEKVILPSF